MKSVLAFGLIFFAAQAFASVKCELTTGSDDDGTSKVVSSKNFTSNNGCTLSFNSDEYTVYGRAGEKKGTFISISDGKGGVISGFNEINMLIQRPAGAFTITCTAD